MQFASVAVGKRLQTLTQTIVATNKTNENQHDRVWRFTIQPDRSRRHQMASSMAATIPFIICVYLHSARTLKDIN